MATTRIGGSLALPYQDAAGEPIPITKGEVVYKMSSLTVEGHLIRVPSTVIAEIHNGVVESKDLVMGVWTADIRPLIPTGYSKRIKFLADKPEMDLADVIPIPIDDMAAVKGDEGAHIVSITTDEQAGSITITLSDGSLFSFPLPHVALSEADRATLDEALTTVTQGTATMQDLADTLRTAISQVDAALQGNLEALANGVDHVDQQSAQVALSVTEADQAREEASQSAQNALQHSESAHGYSVAAQSAQTGAEQALEDLQTGIANGDFKGDPGDAGTTTWAGITDKPDLSGYVESTTVSGLWQGTQAQYDALTPDASTVYIIREG